LPYNAVSTQIYIDKDENGEVVAQEFVKGQMKDQIAIDTETGEILSEEPRVFNFEGGLTAKTRFDK
jgi:hypothetical protein